MSSFMGGSAWAMAKDIGEGHILLTDRTVRRMSPGDLDKLIFEMDRRLRELRGDQPDLDDVAALQTRNRKISRLNTALFVVRGVRFRPSG